MSYDCVICGLSNKTEKDYDKHLNLHRNLKNCHFPCIRHNCSRTFQKQSNYQMHIYRYHSEKSQIITKDKPIKCQIENCNFLMDSKTILNKHICAHILDKDFVLCPLDTICKRPEKFTSAASFKNHVLRYHFDHFKSCSNNAINDTEKLAENDLPVPSLEIIENAEDVSVNLLSNLYLTLQGKHYLNEETLNVIISTIMDIEEYKSKSLERVLLKNNITDIKVINEIKGIKSIFQSAHNKDFGPLRSSYCRKLFFRTNYKFIEPIPISLGRNDSDKESSFYYVPILESIQILLQNKDIQSIINRENKISQEHCIYSDLFDGEVFKKNDFFQNNKNLQIILFQDAFEICNPLGSSKLKHKILAIYMTLGNLPPWLRTKVEHINLVALIYEKQVKDFSFDKCLNRILTDLKTLETTGIQVNNEVFNGSLFAVVGDNLGSHQIGGFLQNFNINNYFCRFCYIKNFKEFNHQSSLRTKERYDNEIDNIDCLEVHEHYHGVKHRSCLNELKHFHICNPGLPPCIGHDLFEGVVAYDLMLCINWFVKNKYFSYDYINKQINMIKLENSLKQSYPKITNCNKLRGSAMENAYLLNVLPFILYDKIDELNQTNVWKMILCLKEICCICFGHQISLAQVAKLRSLLMEYLEYRINNFPNISLKPKHHFILHYPYLIRMFGPLRHLWTMRFESKHRYFKNVIRHAPNFKNVLLYLTTKHQYLQALNSNKISILYSDKILCDDANVFIANDYPKYLESAINKCNSIDINNIYIAQKAENRGITYKKGMYICIEKKENDDFVICLIENMLIDFHQTKLIFFGFKILITYCIDSGLYLEVKTDSTDNETLAALYVCASYENILNCEPLQVYLHNNIKLFNFKSAPLCID